MNIISFENTGSGQLQARTLGPTGQSGNPSYAIVYDPQDKKVSYNANKTFVIDHPLDEDKFLVHACLEGPEAGVYYRGKASITNNEKLTIVLPTYVDQIASNFTVHLTQIYEDVNKYSAVTLKTTEVENNQFTVYGNNCKFFWIVYGERNSIEVEPLKSAVEIQGHGPYKWVK
jgi:hypothetical protein